jgi:phospholipid/cholesterol/gamma-HCH transport system substrate-binding protein
MQSESSLTVKVGILFTIALIFIVGMTLQVQKGSWMRDRYTVKAQFDKANGIEQGGRVTLHGLRIGVVDSLEWSGKNRKVVVNLKIEREFQVPDNAIARVQISSLLGGTMIDLYIPDVEDTGQFLKDGDIVSTEERASMDEVMATVGDVSKKTETLIDSFNENQSKILGNLNEVIEENREDLRLTSQSFAEVGPKLDELAERLNRITAQMESGEGAIGALYADKDLYNQLASIGEKGNDIVDQIQSGNGTLGGLIYSDETLEDVKTVLADLQKAAAEIETAVAENREEVHELFTTLNEATPKLEAALESFNQLGEKINEGEGTLGKLVTDPTLYNDAQKTVNKVGESFENSEEQGVFRSFLGVLFGALI